MWRRLEFYIKQRVLIFELLSLDDLWNNFAMWFFIVLYFWKIKKVQSNTFYNCVFVLFSIPFYSLVVYITIHMCTILSVISKKKETKFCL